MFLEPMINNKEKLTQIEIQEQIHSFCCQRSHWVMAPNIYVLGWESDFISVTNSGYIYEYEIKLSVADYKKDFKKHVVDVDENWRGKRLNKHDCLSGKIERAEKPKRFYFVMPKDMVPVSEIPEYAGLIYAYKYKSTETYWCPNHEEIKVAPDISGYKPITQDQRMKIMTSLSHRFFRHYFKDIRKERGDLYDH